MIKAGVPVIPGSNGEVRAAAEEALGVPIELAILSCWRHQLEGGGKGIRKVERAEDTSPSF